MSLSASASLMILGFATLWSLRVIFGGTRWAANNTVAVIVSIVGWLFILLGIATAVSPVGLLIVLVIFGMTVARYRHGERRALLWTLSLAAEKGIPFSTAVRAFAARRSDEFARRALELAILLDSGVPLAKALPASGNPLPPDTELMVRLSANSKTTAAALRESGEFGDEVEQAWTPIFGQLTYLLLIGICSILILSFIMVRVIPTFKEIFSDFGTALPAATRLTIEVANWCARYSALFIPIWIYLIGSLLIGAYFYARGRIWLPPPLNWLFGRTDKPTLFRGLALCIEQQMPIEEALKRLGRDYPSGKMQKRIAECAGATAVGADWCQVMQEQQLISPAESAVLKSSAAAGSLRWVLRELADLTTRRMIYRANIAIHVATAVGILCMAFPIAWLVISCFLPLISLIQNLT